TMIAEITASDAALAGTSGYDEVRSWFSALREIAAKANPTLPTTYCSTRSIYDGSFSPFFGYHADFNGDPVPDAPVQWRTVITLIGAGTKIIEEKKLKDACRRGTPKYEEAIRIAEAEFPIPTPPAVVQQSGHQSRKQLRVAQRKSDEAWHNDAGNKAHIQYLRLRRATRREEILLGDVPTVCARPGDMVFISQQRPKHLWHGSPQYTGGQRLGLVLDHIMVLNI
ncbi:MAG: hypothetical protein SFW65_09085, partial [Alphaproteobacteria bacterium]|nr:hypothetical protein [Alphaproteobacteria bacterium]